MRPQGRHISRRLQLEHLVGTLAMSRGVALCSVIVVPGSSELSSRVATASTAILRPGPSISQALLLSTAKLCDDFHDLCKFSGLVKEMTRARFRADAAVLRVGVVGQDYEHHLRRERMDLAQYLDAATPGQLNVQHDRIRFRPQNSFDRGLRRVG